MNDENVYQYIRFNKTVDRRIVLYRAGHGRNIDVIPGYHNIFTLCRPSLPMLPT